MVSGHPDWQTWAGTAVGGESIDSFSFTGDFNAGQTKTIDFGAVPTGKQKFYQALVITVPDDTAIHRLVLTRISDGFIWWIQDLLTSGNYIIPGFTFPAGEEVRLTITNNSSSTLTFDGALFSTERNIT